MLIKLIGDKLDVHKLLVFLLLKHIVNTGRLDDVSEACQRLYELIQTRSIYALANAKAKEAVLQNWGLL